MDHLGQIESFIVDINASQNLDEVFLALRRHLERLGFECFTYELMWPGKETKKQPLFITSYPKEWIDHYIEKKYAADDMVCRYSAQTLKPFAWQEISRHPNLTAPQRLVFNEASEIGIRSGASVPIHGTQSEKAHFTVANDMAQDEFMKLFMKCRHELHLIATYAHERIMDFGMHDGPLPSVKLTPREIEIMTWTARGKQREDISLMLSISEETVKVHIRNVCRKLNVYNKTHAVTIAIIHSLIAP